MKTLLLIDWQNTDYKNSDRQHSDVAIDNGKKLLNIWRSKNFNLVHVLLDSEKIFQTNAWRRTRLKQESPILDNSIITGFAPQDGEPYLWKPDRSAFFGTQLENMLSAGQEVYCTGASTTGCVLATAIHGDALGYQMHFVHDCMFDKDEQRHNKGVEILGKFGRVVNHNDIV